MTKSIYDRFDSATKGISAYAIFKGADYIGRVIVKYPKNGAGRLTAFVHAWGRSPVAGTAGGCGYDKVGAALFDASKKVEEYDPLYIALSEVTYDGQWRSVLESNGFTVHNVI